LFRAAPVSHSPPPPPICFSAEGRTRFTSTLSLHGALPTCHRGPRLDVADHPSLHRHPRPASDRDVVGEPRLPGQEHVVLDMRAPDRKSTRLNSSHASTSYAVFCWQKTSHGTTHTPQRDAAP